MPDRERDLVGLFVRDLDSIELPERGRWRPAPRKESVFMRASRYVLTATAVAAVLILALLWSFSQRPNPVAASASPSATASAALSASAIPSTDTRPLTAPPSATAQPTTAATGTITGQFGYPSDFVPPLTVYAISVNDSNVWYSTNTPYLGNFTRPTPSPTPSFNPTWPPAGEGRYQLAVPAGTYYVVAYSNDTGLPKDLPAAYTRYTIDCIQKTVSNSPPPACGGNDHTLVPVTIQAGQTLSTIDIRDWQFQAGQFPPRPAPR
jgi:hypothetical protein